MDNKTRERKAAEVAELTIKALQHIGCTAVIVMIDPGGDKSLVMQGHKRGNEREIFELAASGAAKVMSEVAAAHGLDTAPYADAVASMRDATLQQPEAGEYLAEYTKATRLVRPL